MKRFLRRGPLAACALATVLCAPAAHADTLWTWSYTGTGIDASGTFTTTDTADANGFFAITSITGQRNGDAITGLVPAGTAIPGNEPYAVDDLVKAGPGGQVTVEGFGFALASGGYVNPYFADYLPVPAYSEVYTTASSFGEVPIAFQAAPVPEPATVAMLLAGLGVVGFAKRRSAGTADRRSAA